MSKRVLEEESTTTLPTARVEQLLKDEKYRATKRKNRAYKKAMAKLPSDKTETVCGSCGEEIVSRLRAVGCKTCKAPICEHCVKQYTSLCRSKWEWQHQVQSRFCMHPKHPKCANHRIMKVIRKEAKDALECEVCEHRRMKEEEKQDENPVFTPYELPVSDDEDDEEDQYIMPVERPITQPSSPEMIDKYDVKVRTCSRGCPKRGLFGCPDECFIDWSAEGDKILTCPGGMSASSNGADFESN